MATPPSVAPMVAATTLGTIDLGRLRPIHAGAQRMVFVRRHVGLSGMRCESHQISVRGRSYTM